MGKYDAWRSFFESLTGHRRTIPMAELETLIVGGLPPSARKYQAWWSGGHSQEVWQQYGWKAQPDLRNERVTFIREGKKATSVMPATRKMGETRPEAADTPASRAAIKGDRLVLVGCVKTKVDHAAPAKDLYNSPLWWKRRRYAESTGMPWAILSAEHGMVDPDTVLEPYDRYLGNESTAYKRWWSERTARQVLAKLRNLGMGSVEVHAGSAYLDNGLEDRLVAAGIEVSRPLEGLTFGQQLGWYE